MTRARVGPEIGPLLRIVRDTVISLTPATAATSARVTAARGGDDVRGLSGAMAGSLLFGRAKSPRPY